MKKWILLLHSWLPLLLVAQTDAGSLKFSVSGTLKNLKDSVVCVYIHYVANNARVTDSAKVNKGKYVLSGMLSEPTIAQLQPRYKGQAAATEPVAVTTLFLENGPLTITSTGSFTNMTVKGGLSDRLFKEFEQKLRPYGDSMQQFYTSYMEARQKNDFPVMLDIETKAVKMETFIKDSVIQPFILNNAQSPVALFALQQMAGNQEVDVERIEPLYDKLSETVRNYPSGLELKERITVASRTAIGRVAADFTQTDTLGKPVSLSSLKGKYVLLDFWASWCGPCRQENPNLVQAFEKYKDRGFFVLGVSLDRPGAKEAWLKAIHDDKLAWTHVSDLQFWNNAAAKLYGVQSIPQNFLLDPSGKIIAKNLRGPELHAKLEEVLGAAKP